MKNQLLILIQREIYTILLREKKMTVINYIKINDCLFHFIKIKEFLLKNIFKIFKGEKNECTSSTFLFIIKKVK